MAERRSIMITANQPVGEWNVYGRRRVEGGRIR